MSEKYCENCPKFYKDFIISVTQFTNFNDLTISWLKNQEKCTHEIAIWKEKL